MGILGKLSIKLHFLRIIQSLSIGVLLFFVFIPQPGFALPEGGSVAGGGSTISTPTPGTMQIDQSTDRSIINWQTYNIGAQERVNYTQPNAGSISLNRINPNNGVSAIFGTLTANGQVWLVNPAGIWFGPTAHVDVGGLLATTAGISDHDFMSGNFRFIQSPDWNGGIANEGTIIVRNAGLAALVGPGVVNNGRIEANLGTVVLGSGREFTVDFAGDQLIQFAVGSSGPSGPVNDPRGGGKFLRDAVNNSGAVIASGGKIMLAARTAGQILDNAINMQGVTEAKSVGVKNGEIIFMGGEGQVKVTGKVDASGRKHSEAGGRVKILGKMVALAEEATVDVSGYQGGGEVLIGGDYQGKNAAIPNAERTFVGSNTQINADAITEGQGGRVIVWANQDTRFYGTIFARGGAILGDGGFVETSGKEILEIIGGRVDASATNGAAGHWLIDPRNVAIVAATMGGAFSGVDPIIFTPTANNATVDAGTINTALDGGTSVTVNTGTTGGQAGNITVTNAILKSSGATTPTLELDAAGAITINNTISSVAAGGLNILLTGNSLTQNSAITTNGGNFSSITQNVTTLANSINAGSGTVSIAANQDGTGGQDFNMNAGSSITTTNSSASAVDIKVNTAAGGSGSAVLRDITTGSGGKLTVTTDTGSNTTGGTITTPSGTLNVGSLTMSTSNTIALTGTINAQGPVTLSANTDGAGGQDFNMNAGSSITTTDSTANAVQISVNKATGGTGTATLRDITTGSAGKLTVTTDTGGNTTGGSITTPTGTLNIGSLFMSAGDAITLTGDINGQQSITLAANTDGAGGQDFNMNAGSSITTADSSANAVHISVNQAAGGTGMATLRDITTGNGGTITVQTDTGNNATGRDITHPSGLLNVGTGTVTLTNPKISGTNIGTAGANIQIAAGNLNARSGTNGIFVTNSGTGPLNLGFIDTSDGFTLISTGSAGITDTGPLTVPGTTTLTAGAAQNITLDNPANDFGTVSIVSGNNVTLVDANALDLAASTVSGNLGINTHGTLTISGALDMLGSNKTATFVSNNHPININAEINGANYYILNAGASGDITINANLGATTRFNTLTIQNVRNLISNATIQTSSYVQNAGSGITQFNNGGLQVIGNAFIAANRLLGNINVGSLTINLSTGDFFGTVNGLTGVPAIRQFTILNPLFPGRIFFDGIDIWGVFNSPFQVVNSPFQVVIPMNYLFLNIYLFGFNSSMDDLVKDLSVEFKSKKISGSCIEVSKNIIICEKLLSITLINNP